MQLIFMTVDLKRFIYERHLQCQNNIYILYILYKIQKPQLTLYATFRATDGANQLNAEFSGWGYLVGSRQRVLRAVT